MYASTGNLYAAPSLVRLGAEGLYATVRPPPPPHLQPPPPAACSPPLVATLPRALVPAAAPEGSLLPFHAPPYADPRYQSLDRTALYARRAPPGLVHMRLSPGSGPPIPQQQVPAPGQPFAASVRLSTPFGDPNITAVIEPHYSALPPPSSNRSSPVPAASVIRVSGGQQQTIRVPYAASGTQPAVQVHLLARAGVGVGGAGAGAPLRSDSPQRLASPCGAPPPPGVARATQTAASPLFPVVGGGALVEPMKASTASSSPTRSLKYSAASGTERGVPEGAASNSPCFPQDTLYLARSEQQVLSSSQASPVATPGIIAAPGTATSSVYYAMNV